GFAPPRLRPAATSPPPGRSGRPRQNRLRCGGPEVGMGRRAEVLAELARVVLEVVRPHPVRVAIDGCSAAGKTTLADELAQVLRDRTDREIIRAGIDYFKRAFALRTAYPVDSPEGYYLDTWDNEAIRDRLLIPLGPGGDRRYTTAIMEPSARAALESPI